MTPRCLWEWECLCPWLLISCHLCHGDTHGYIHKQHENTHKPSPRVCSNQGQSKASRGGRRVKENPEGPLVPRHQPCHLEGQGGGRGGEETAPIREGEPSGDLQEAPPTSVPRGLRQGIGCFLPMASLCVPTVCGCVLSSQPHTFFMRLGLPL